MGKLWTYKPSQHKTAWHGHERVIYLGPRAQDVLRPFLKKDLQAFIFQPAEADLWRREQLHLKRKTPLSYGNRPGSNRTRHTIKRISEEHTSELQSLRRTS